MRPISTDGLANPTTVSAGPRPTLQWIAIADLVVDPTYQRPIEGNARTCITQIASAFQWACFTPIVVASLDDGRFAIIDGQRRTTAAALAGFDSVPCQIVEADHRQQAIAHKLINGDNSAEFAHGSAQSRSNDQRTLRRAFGRNLCAGRR